MAQSKASTYVARTDRRAAATLTPWRNSLDRGAEQAALKNAQIDCGWGRLIFGHTFTSNEELARGLRHEEENRRDIALYVADPHVVVSLAPQELFIDPSHTYRLYFHQYRPPPPGSTAFRVRKLQTEADARGVNAIYALRHMVTLDPTFIFAERRSGLLVYLVAEDTTTGEIIGTVTGVDHVEAINDPESGCSLWALAVHPQTTHPGVGMALVTHLIEHFMARGRDYIDLSVMHDNNQAIRLYEKLGFVRVPVFCVKNKNKINEPLFTGQAPDARLNPYAQIIVREALRRGIGVDVLDEEAGYFSLTFGGRTIICRESLSELTNSIAMSRCDDKRVTRRLLAQAGLAVPEQISANNPEAVRGFLERHKAVVVKPARGEQGTGISVGVRTEADLQGAIEYARRYSSDVIIEQFVQGADLRVIVIDYRVAAAAVRRPPEVTATGEHTVRQLVQKQSRRRAAATQGMSQIPLDAETERCVQEAGYAMTDVPPAGTVIVVRKAANLHSGGTIHDVTDEIHPTLVEAAKRAAEVLNIPVVGLDFIVPNVRAPQYWIIEANERPGLANHEPQPTAERFIDLLFPQTVT